MVAQKDVNKRLELNFLAHPLRQYHLLMFSNTGHVSKTKHNLTYRMGEKIKLQSLVPIFTKYCWISHIIFIFHKVV